jgi:uncharacterized protein YndB with AHSA1/START domain
MAEAATRGTAVVTLPSDTEILITRAFAAPRHLVWRAYTEPELIRRWWAGERGEVMSVEIDLRVGGRWRYVLRANEGVEVAFHGEFREVVPDERIVTTEVYEGAPGGDEDPAVNEVTFVDEGARSVLEILMRCPSKEVRDAVIDSGMEGGMQEGMDLLERIAISLSA